MVCTINSKTFSINKNTQKQKEATFKVASFYIEINLFIIF